MSEHEQASHFGWIKALSIVLGVYLFLGVLVQSSQDTANSASSRVTSAPTATPTSRPTATPAAPMDDPIAWGQYAADKNMSSKLSLADVALSSMSGEIYLSIACNMSTMYSNKAYIVEAAEFISGVIPLIRDVQGFDHVTFLFYGTFVDKYGNTTQQLGMRAMYSRQTLQLVNAEYFADYAAANPYGIFNAADTSLIHPTYKN